jgi:cytoskeleton protein RodZ
VSSPVNPPLTTEPDSRAGEPLDPVASADAPGNSESPGAMLARQRCARGLSLAEVAGRLKFGTRQIEALEADDYARLPGSTFVRGMIRGYAKLLDADPQPLLNALEAQHVVAPVAQETPAKRVPFPDGRSRSTRVYLVLSAILVVAVGLVAYEWEFGLPSLSSPDSVPGPVAETAPAQAAVAEAPAVAEPSVQAAPAQNAVPAPAQKAAPALAQNAAPAPPAAAIPASPKPTVGPGGPRILFEFQEESWVEVKDRKGQVLMSQLNPAASRRLVEGEPPLSVVIGNANHVRMSYRDAPFDLKPHIKVEVARLTLQ